MGFVETPDYDTLTNRTMNSFVLGVFLFEDTLIHSGDSVIFLNTKLMRKLETAVKSSFPKASPDFAQPEFPAGVVATALCPQLHSLASTYQKHFPCHYGWGRGHPGSQFDGGHTDQHIPAE